MSEDLDDIAEERPEIPPHVSMVERRVTARRGRRGDAPPKQSLWSIAGVALLVTLVTNVLLLGIAWGTTGEKLANKVDVKEQIKRDDAQDAALGTVTATLSTVATELRETNTRLREIACKGQGPSCR